MGSKEAECWEDARRTRLPVSTDGNDTTDVYRALRIRYSELGDATSIFLACRRGLGAGPHCKPAGEPETCRRYGLVADAGTEAIKKSR